MDDEAIERFIDYWRGSAGGETVNFQSFAGELCDLLGVPRPDRTVHDDDRNLYVFEKSVRIDNGDGTRSALSADLKAQELLDMLVSIGQARVTDEGRYSAR